MSVTVTQPVSNHPVHTRLLPECARPWIMGILNCTPDSFFDGGRYNDPVAALAHADAMIAEGADFIDVGGESTRPGSSPVDSEEQIRRIIPVIKGIRSRWDGPISVDTTRSDVAEAALDAGANWINDVSALRDDSQMGPLAAAQGAGVVLMHMLGAPRTMQMDPRYDDVISEIGAFLEERARHARSFGIRKDRIVIDPGIGFGKTVDHNLAILNNLASFAGLGYPLLIGASRKSFIAGVLGDEHADRLEGSLVAALLAARNGAAILRVHDVGATRRALAVQDAIASHRS